MLGYRKEVRHPFYMDAAAILMNNERKERNCIDELVMFLNDENAMNASIQIPDHSETDRHFVQFVKVKGETSFTRQPVVYVYGGEFSDACPRIKQLNLLGVWYDRHIYTRDSCLVHGITYGFAAFKDIFKAIDIELQITNALNNIYKETEAKFPEALVVAEEVDLENGSVRERATRFIIQQEEDGRTYETAIRENFKEYLNNHLGGAALGDMLFDLPNLLECKKHKFMEEKASDIEFLLRLKAIHLKAIATIRRDLPQAISMARDIYAAAAKAGTTTTVHLSIGGKKFVAKMRTQSLMYGDTTYPTWDISPKQTREEIETALRKQGMHTLTPDLVTKICFGRKVLYEKSKAN